MLPEFESLCESVLAVFKLGTRAVQRTVGFWVHVWVGQGIEIGWKTMPMRTC